MLRSPGTLLASVVAALVATTGSVSAAGWQPPVNARTADDGGFATEVAVDAQGNAVGVWARHVSGLDWEIVAASRPRGGSWASAVGLSGAQRTVQLRPKVAVDPNGNAVAVWLARPAQAPGNEETFRAIWAASRTPGGVWSQPVKIADASGGDMFDVVIDASGTATAIWHALNEGEDEPAGSFVRTASRPLDGEWSEPVELSVSNGGPPRWRSTPTAT